MISVFSRFCHTHSEAAITLLSLSLALCTVFCPFATSQSLFWSHCSHFGTVTNSNTYWVTPSYIHIKCYD